MSNRAKYILRLVLLVATLIGALWLGSVAEENPAVQNLLVSGGYVGVFLFSVINGFNVFVPVVTASFVPALSAAGLNAYLVVAVMTLGVTVADLTAFFLAQAGRVHLTGLMSSLMQKVTAAQEKRPWFPLSLLALWAIIVPLPNEIVLIPLGLMGYRAMHIIPVIIAGNLVFNAGVGLGFFALVEHLMQ